MKHFRSRSIWIAAVAFNLTMSISGAAEPRSVKLRCGWFDNPSAGNAWLHDSDGEWAVSVQGGHSAKGEWPVFPDSEWIQTGSGSSGYGCACMRVSAKASSHEITHIASSKTKSLSSCRADRKLKEPSNPLDEPDAGPRLKRP